MNSMCCWPIRTGSLWRSAPAAALTGSAIRHPRWSSGHRAVRLMRHQIQNVDDRDTLLLGLGQLWSAGLLSTGHPSRPDPSSDIVSLPGYPFAHATALGRPQAGQLGRAGRREHRCRLRPPTAQPSTPMSPSTASRRPRRCCSDLGAVSGSGSIDRTANFFELGGDSLIAIGVAMTAANEGLDLTPQDLYENQTVAALAKALVARYAAGGLATVAEGRRHPPFRRTSRHFLEHGLREAGRWRAPLILRFARDVSVDDVRSVLTAVTNHHDALRLQIVAARGNVGAAHRRARRNSPNSPLRSLPDGLGPEAREEREAVSDIAERADPGQDLSSPPLTATYVSGAPGGPATWRISVHEIVADNASRDILITDIFTAFANAWRANASRCNRSPHPGGSGHSAAPLSPRTRRSLDTP